MVWFTIAIQAYVKLPAVVIIKQINLDIGNLIDSLRLIDRIAIYNMHRDGFPIFRIRQCIVASSSCLSLNCPVVGIKLSIFFDISSPMEPSGTTCSTIVPRFPMRTVIIIDIDLIPVVVVSATDIPMSSLDINITFLPIPFVIWTQRNSFAHMDGDFTEVIIEVEQPVSGTVRSIFDFTNIMPPIFIVTWIRIYSTRCAKITIIIPITFVS